MTQIPKCVILNQYFFQVYAGKVISHLSYLADENIEDLKILQTVIVLLTTSNVVQQDSLAKVPAVFLRTIQYSHWIRGVLAGKDILDIL